MRKLTINTFLTLDGVMQAPGGPEEDTTGGFTHGGWSVKYWDDMMGQTMDDVFKVPFDLLLGRKTYEIFAAHWPHITDEPAANALNKATKYVASKTLKRADWQGSNLLNGDVPRQVAELKKQDGPEIQVHGSANLIQTLLRHDLIDEFRLWIFPLVLGTGKRLFDDGTIPASLRLLSTKPSSTGVVISTFHRGGEIGYGSFALEQPTEEEVARRRTMTGEAAPAARR